MWSIYESATSKSFVDSHAEQRERATSRIVISARGDSSRVADHQSLQSAARFLRFGCPLVSSYSDVLSAAHDYGRRTKRKNRRLPRWSIMSPTAQNEPEPLNRSKAGHLTFCPNWSMIARIRLIEFCTTKKTTSGGNDE